MCGVMGQEQSDALIFCKKKSERNMERVQK